MSDQTTSDQAAAGKGQSQPTTPPAGQGGEQQGQAPKFITRDEALQIFSEQFGKQGQSIADRTTARVQKVLDAAKAQGLTITPQQAQAMLEATAESAQPRQVQSQAASQSQAPSQAANAQSQQAPGNLQQQSPAAYDPVTSKAVAILQDEFGLKDIDPEHLDTEEPEYKLLDMETADPEKFLASVRAYGKAKAERLQQAGDSARLPSLGNGKPSTTPAHANMRGRDVLEEYYRNHQT